jgi:hypothetical protein
MVVISASEEELLSTSLPLSSLLRDRELLLALSEPEEELFSEDLDEEADRDLRLLLEFSLASLLSLSLLFLLF